MGWLGPADPTEGERVACWLSKHHDTPAVCLQLHSPTHREQSLGLRWCWSVAPSLRHNPSAAHATGGKQSKTKTHLHCPCTQPRQHFQVEQHSVEHTHTPPPHKHTCARSVAAKCMFARKTLGSLGPHAVLCRSTTRCRHLQSWSLTGQGNSCFLTSAPSGRACVRARCSVPWYEVQCLGTRYI